ncbi:cycloisomaltooligosaccharide glucanotransferase [Sphingobacterium phlebotomi]|uniref:Cycloisomaltooligosaccharide glucanotransferase n=2 Tax=Sphingobacterium phlebotomi TaxID=2605433 RepID=A0A5D4HF97_9SPHI|nr:cycloisomaltooligosaccharide glucanotransferase [Sphingobacterium phlebotomi]
MKKVSWSLLVCAALLSGSCKDYYDVDSDPITFGETYFKPVLNTDMAVYKPGDQVRFSLDSDVNPQELTVCYTHLGEVLKEEKLTGSSWTWSPPSDDFKGYLVYVYKQDDPQKKALYSIAVDVSSEWTKFPRYGFVSSYERLSTDAIQRNIENLSRFHINGVQFYDWKYDHQKPLAGTPENPAESWPDLIGRINYKSTVDGYIHAAQDKGMKAMFYNLLFGALSNAASDGVREEWYLFKDADRQEKDLHPLDPPFRSSIYLTNPANVEWQEYLNRRHQEVYDVFDFDGFHIDQLGGRGTVYDYNGNEVDLAQAYKPFIESTIAVFPDKYHVMNSVTQYGQESPIGTSEVDFLYTEIWDPFNSFDQLVGIIHDNYRYSGYKKNSVLAAYMNYGRSNQPGFVNEPGIVLTNAVIFANGGAHLEIGEHYLTNEYFPNNNLQLRGRTKDKLITYYDFMVGYQNLLRDGGDVFESAVQAQREDVQISNGNAVQGRVSTYGRRFSNRDVIHFVNFNNASTMEWRDNNGTQREPNTLTDATFKVPVAGSVQKVWTASPDVDAGAPQELPVEQQGNEITVTLPRLQYWDMLVIEY